MDPETSWSHTTVLAADPSSPSVARAFVTQHLAEHGLHDLVDDVQLTASELATNAVRHARTSFTLSLTYTDSRVVLTVHDESPRTPFRVDAEALDIRGRGLQIVEALSDDWGVLSQHPDAKSVWASFGARPSDASGWQESAGVDDTTASHRGHGRAAGIQQLLSLR